MLIARVLWKDLFSYTLEDFCVNGIISYSLCGYVYKYFISWNCETGILEILQSTWWTKM